MRSRGSHGLAGAAALAALCCGALAAGCGGGSGGGDEVAKKAPPPGENIRLPKTSKVKLKPGFHASNFRDTAAGKNKWDPVKPGRQSVNEGAVTVGHRRLTHRRVYTITDVSKEIDGVKAVIAMDQDFNGGQLSETALDYLAEDRAGNVWYLGSYTEAYEGGQFVNATDGWLAGSNGSKAGTLMEADPRVGDTYYAAKVAGEGSAATEVVKKGIRKCVPFRCYDDVVVLQEGGGDGGEWKYYGPGVGEMLIEPRYEGGEQETERLINARVLSSRALAELSAEALKIDRHASSQFPDVFGRAAPAKRGL